MYQKILPGVFVMRLKKILIGTLLFPICSFADDCTCFFITGDFIYWRVQEEGLGFAETGSTTGFGVTGTNVSRRGSDQEPKFNWEPGFKVGAGFDFSCDDWDLYAQYTYLRTNPGTASVSREASNTTDTLKNKWHIKGANPITDMIFASGSWKLNFNVINLELGRSLCPTDCLKIRPFIGFKGAWLDDDLTFNYQLNETNFPLLNMTNNIDYWGIGIRAGMNTSWYLCDNFAIFGNIALTPLRARYDIDRQDRTTPDAAAPEVTFLERNTTHNFSTIKGIFEFIIGLRYDLWWCDCSYHLGIEAGWEEQVWVNHNNHYVPIEDFSLGNLTLQGLTVQLRFDF